MSTKRNVAIGTGAAAVIAATVAFLPNWEGMDKVARRDPVGTGHPITYCYGQTSEFGDVKVGTRFTKQECDDKLAESLPKYLAGIDGCIKVPLPVKTVASVLDASYNAGIAAACHSPMLAKMNAGDIRGGCEAFAGWRITGNHQVLPGLIARRGGRPHDSRKSERDLCLEGLSEPKSSWYVGTGVEALNHSPELKPLMELTPEQFKIDPYACFGAGRYQAMSEARSCPVKKPKRWWER